MSDERARPQQQREAGKRSGGPAPSVPSDTDIAVPPWLGRCECREAQLLRGVGTGELPLPDIALWQTLNAWIEESAVARLRQVSHALAGEPFTGSDDGSDHWHRVAAAPSHVDLERLRTTYDRPPRTPEQIRASAAYSWRRFDREAS